MKMNQAKKSQLREIQLQLTDLKNRLEAIHWELGEDIPVDQSLKIGKAFADIKSAIENLNVWWG